MLSGVLRLEHGGLAVWSLPVLGTQAGVRGAISFNYLLLFNLDCILKFAVLCWRWVRVTMDCLQQRLGQRRFWWYVNLLQVLYCAFVQFCVGLEVNVH